MERVERRGSIARAISRLRIAMKRRRPTDTQATRNDNPVDVTEGLYAPPMNSTGTNVPHQRPTTQLTCSTSLSNGSTTTPRNVRTDQQLEPDADEYTDNEEPLLPIASNRPGISEDKARDLFSRYGLLYQAQNRSSREERPRKLRRVERPIRIKVHWTCHVCRTQFKLENSCVECGHQRCSQCSRQPPKRVQEVLESGRYAMEQSEMSQQENESSDEEPRQPSVDSTPNSTPAHSPMPSPSPSLDLDSDLEADGQFDHPSFDSSFYVRPGAAIRLFKSDYGHDQFGEHQRITKMNQCSMGLSGYRTRSDGDVPTMRAVQRVYRKPRQRVRYTCEHCSTTLIEGGRCRECDHDRFLRNPPRRTPIQYDADIFQMVTNRLAAHGGFAPQQGITV